MHPRLKRPHFQIPETLVECESSLPTQEDNMQSSHKSKMRVLKEVLKEAAQRREAGDDDDSCSAPPLAAAEAARKKRALKLRALREEKKGEAPLVPVVVSSSSSGSGDEDNESLSPADRRKRERMMRNRESAALSRKRNRDKISSLEADNAQLKKRANRAEDESRTLRRKIFELEAALQSATAAAAAAAATTAASTAATAATPSPTPPAFVIGRCEPPITTKAGCFNRDPEVFA